MTHYDPHDWDPHYNDDTESAGRAIAIAACLLIAATIVAVLVAAI